ncbi:UDP-glycosyltransferase 90A2 [Brachypodium distachyon]|uniref:Glycosyltransferase n=1 Tax=Brachypodium distachyon TaxID=15368 RepID=I1GZ40_BRADI|nr:UDP-glycosyltransferase 90A2 [Brachypodium distachyon]KQK18635.1 hypothetical protein BRADI_1g43760v3 [Brachypodium distachyon]|eukprot:XP_003563966.1 UDP-glycosyltransferase 90A2 [Brachypodium distachyon]
MAPPPPLRHVAMFPFMAKGHAMPLIHLARLLLDRGLASSITFFTTPRNAPFLRASLAGTPAAFVELPFPSEDAPQSMDELPSASSCFGDFIYAVADALGPAFADALARIEPRPDVLVHDGFLFWAKQAADELAVPRLVTCGFSAFASYVAHAVMAHRPLSQVASPSEPFPLHGVSGGDLRLTQSDLHPPFDDPAPSGPLWDFVCQSSTCMHTSAGIIANTFDALESCYVDLWNRSVPQAKMWPVGPLCLASSAEQPVQATTTDIDREILDWLDSRLAMDRPVLYVAFGSQAELSRAQLEEVAVGLELSGLDFIWVVRPKWFDHPEDELIIKDRFGDRGKVVQGFINQLQVLSHGATKGFFTHCGWNSVLESIATGVPMLAFPMAAEQKLNAKFVVDVVHAGLRVWHKEGGLVVSGDVQASARELVLGEGGRRAAAGAAELSMASRKAMDVGGSSFENLARMVQEVSEIGGAPAESEVE